MPRSRRLRLAGRFALALLLFPLASAWPRSRRRWAFGTAGDQFSGNPKYLYLWMRLHRPDVRITWVTGRDRTHAMLARMGLPVARRWSAAGIWAALRSGFYVFSHDPIDINLPLSRGARHLNLWHGVGVKALHEGAKPGSGLRRWLRSFVYVPYDTVASTSDAMQAHFAEQFRLPPERCPQIGYPRLDAASAPEVAALARATDEAVGFRFNPMGAREIYIYLPTFRDSGRPFLAEALPDLDALERVLARRGAMLWVKLHPRTPDALPEGRHAIRAWPAGIDFQTYLADLTGMITDYSSILYDYLAVKRTGAILYTFDYDAYTSGDRQLRHDFEDSVAGTRAGSFAELCQVLATGSALTEPVRVDAVRERFWSGSPQPASPAVVAWAERELGLTGGEKQAISARGPRRRRLKRLISSVLALTFSPLSKLVPRARRQWAFGHAGDQFAGNPKYLFLWMAIHRPDLRVSWITGDEGVRRMLRDAGYRAYCRWSVRGMIAALRAHVFVFGHGLGNVNATLSGGAYLLNLWHGVGLKAIHLGFARGKTAEARRAAGESRLRRALAVEYLRPYDALVTTSDMMQAHFATQTELPPERCPQLGYPRLDGNADPALLAAVEAFDKANGFVWNAGGFAETYIYMPTYRDTGRPFLDMALPDLDRLSRVLAGRHALLYVKPHPDTRGNLDERHNVRRWDDRIDVNAYLPRMTGLITDYSSVLYDYLFARDTGTILYTFDLDAYLAADRDLVHPFEENVAGVRVADFDALCGTLESGAALVPDSRTPVIRARFWGGSPDCASAAIVEHVMRELAA